jgi:hypothetical protein
MDKLDLLSPSSERKHVAAKRKAEEEPSTSPDTKRIGSFDERLADPDSKVRTAGWRVPFPEKVC